jgi:ABC-type phosphate transport system substrate-binding protein
MNLRFYLLAILLAWVCVSSSLPAETKVTRISGNDATLRCQEAIMQKFMKDNPGVRLTYAGGGDFRGVGDLISGKSKVAVVRGKNMWPYDVGRLKKAFPEGQPQPESQLFTVIGIVFSTSPNIKAKNITPEQIGKIFSGQAKTWNELGLGTGEIIRVGTGKPSIAGGVLRREILKPQKLKMIRVIRGTPTSKTP